MLPSFELGQLALPAALIFGVAGLAAWRVTGSVLIALALASAKTAPFLIYFGLVFDGTYTYLDDWTYLERGAALDAAGVTPFNLLQHLPLLLAAGEGNHFLYYLVNAVAVGLFGDGYYAPVALNVVASVGVAWVATRLLVREGLCPPRWTSALFAFALLHPDILAWSTVLNGKDTLVLLLHVLLLTALSWQLRGRRLAALALAGAATAALLFLRFYVPLLFALALALSAATQIHQRGRLRLLLLGAALMGGLAAYFGPAVGEQALDAVRSDLVNPLTGFVRFVLTPIPLNTDDNYAFLDVPATLHWLLLPAVILGVWRVWHHGTAFTRYLLAYTAVFAALYATYGELQGPRHRLQLDFAWLTFQFVGLLGLPRLVDAWRHRRAARERPATSTALPP
ncbi:MAG: hypothetical protein ABIX12_07240 [Rubrivivax sp.]